MNLPDQLEILAHGMTAMLATWLGITVAMRAPRRGPATAFVVLAVLLVGWSVSILVRRLTGDPTVDEPARWFEVAGASLLPPAVLTVATALTAERTVPRVLRGVLIAFWLLSIAITVLTIVAPELEPRIAPPHLSLPGVPGAVVGWAWIIVRIGIFAAAIGWVAIARAEAGPDPVRRRQLTVTGLALVIGTIGGIARITPPLSDTEPWIGVSLVTVSLVLTVYAVFAQGIFFGADVAHRAFRYSAAVGVGVSVYVSALVVLDSVVRTWLAVDVPIVIALALVATVALIEPVTVRLRRWAAGADEADPAYERLLRALGEGMFASQRPEEGVAPALWQLTRTLGLAGAEVRHPDGRLLARAGFVDAGADVFTLERGDVAYGTVAFGHRESGAPLTDRDRELLDLATGYLAASLELSDRQARQARALEALSRERAALTSTGSRLHGALAASVAGDRVELRVYALGPLRAERGGEPIRAWGGEKAGTRQAEALFAFLFDRGELGVTKDEAVELIWPDVDLGRADLAFHRTLGGLRRTLDPGRGQRAGSRAIGFSNDRYRLEPGVVSWTDVATFSEHLGAAGDAHDPAAAMRELEAARALSRGPYLDDCPFYGDSAEVEDTRGLLRGRCVDLLLHLGELHEERGDRGAAAAAFREARITAVDACPSADAALARLGAG